ncbi:hypothetical protein GGR51DRAFT_534980 [Nemania sp. FL0031]|nr:hypothetical protein GGR51DRAFT_534980 [Nemania sp. FL0031]
MSSIVTADHRRQCTLDQLPVELILHIMKLSPSLSALWSLINTSGRLAAVFHGAALEIITAVLQSTVHDEIQVFIRAVIQLRSSAFPPSLDIARQPAMLYSPISPPPAITPEILRRFLHLAHGIHVLARECIDHYIKVCVAMNPSCLDDPTWEGFNNALPPHMNLPKGRPYEPKDSGPPVYAEEQLVVWNLWRVQYFYDIRVAHDTGRLEWSLVEQDELLSMTLPEFYHLYNHLTWGWEQLMTVDAYVIQVRDREKAQPPFRLPCPTALSRFDWPYSPEPWADHPNAEQPHPEFVPDGWIFAKLMSHSRKYTPLYGFALSHFRKFGFALWRGRRMVDLGLMSDRTRQPDLDYSFRWHSILSEEERDPANADLDVLDDDSYSY